MTGRPCASTCGRPRRSTTSRCGCMKTICGVRTCVSTLGSPQWQTGPHARARPSTTLARLRRVRGRRRSRGHLWFDGSPEEYSVEPSSVARVELGQRGSSGRGCRQPPSRARWVESITAMSVARHNRNPQRAGRDLVKSPALCRGTGRRRLALNPPHRAPTGARRRPALARGLRRS